VATAPGPSAAFIATVLASSGPGTSASETQEAWPATSPPLGPVIADVTPPVRATAIATERAS
jgi:hypothetical protein